MAHLKYAVLSVCQWYSPHLCVSEIKFVPGKVDETISQFTSAYYSCFSSKYASKLTIKSMFEYVSSDFIRTLYNVCTQVSVPPRVILITQYEDEPQRKKPKTERWITPTSPG